jgi:uncharacterized NAD(P)/FAD-binding protein YdhS
MDAIIRDFAPEDEHVTITLIEPNKQVGPGRAYKGDGEYALLNRQTRFMSIRAEEPSHFIDWIREEIGPEAAEQEFVPRSLFGEYLTSQFRRQIEKSRDLGSPISVVSTSATAMYCDGGKIRVVTAQGESLIFDAAVLCIGTAEPTDVFGLSGSRGFISPPYPIWLTCAGIKPHEHVALLGSSLTAMDTVLGLRSQNHVGRITLLSRHRLLPAVRQPHQEIALRFLSQERVADCVDADGYLNVAQVIELVRNEFEAQGVPFSLIEVECALHQCPVERLDRHLTQIESREFWQPLFIKIANDFIEFVWQKLRETDRINLLKNYHHLFMSICNPMPPNTAKALEDLIESGLVSVAPGVKSIEPDTSGGFLVSDGSNNFHVDRIVNVSRPESAGVGRLGKPLVDALVGTGDAQFNPHGGVKVEPATLRVPRRNGRPNANLFAIGQLAAGGLYYTSSLAMITRQVERMVPHLLALVGKKVRTDA